MGERNETAVILSPSKAALLERWRQGAALSTGCVIHPRSTKGELPLTFGQMRLWLIEQYEPGMPTYHLFFCARIGESLNADVLSASVGELARRHEILRTTFSMDADNPTQYVGTGNPPHLEVADMHAGDEGRGLAEAIELIDDAIHKPFDLAHGPLGRILLCQLQGYNLLALVVHHLIADGWSLGLALRELSTIYEARLDGQSPQLPPLTIQYGDFAIWQRETLRDANWQSDLDYWRARLKDIGSLNLAPDHPRPKVITSRGDWREFRLSPTRSAELRRLARQQDATLFMVLLAALKVLLREISDQDDIVVGTAIANRGNVETFGLIGNFINTLVLRTNLQDDPTFRGLLQRVKETCVGAFAHQQAPFERVVKEVLPTRDLSKNVLFQVGFVLQPPSTEMQFAGLPMKLIELGSRSTRSEIEFDLWDQPEIVGRVSFSTDLFYPEMIERRLQRLYHIIAAIVSDPGRRVSEL
jgi:NRPS condensation-like uncharacterized protein